MKLYAVVLGFEGIASVFSTAEIAKAYIENNRDVVGWDAFIVQIEVDNPLHNELTW